MVTTPNGTRPPTRPAGNAVGSPPRDAQPAEDFAPVQAATALAEQLAGRFADQVKASLQFELDRTPTSLAVVDHYLSELYDEDRGEIIELVAAGAGAYFGELIRRRAGGFWLGDGKDPRRSRLLLEPHFCFFSPTDLAIAAIVHQGRAGTGSDRARLANGLDDSFHFRTEPPAGVAIDAQPHQRMSDADWVAERLAELSPVDDAHYHSLTGRFESLELILEMLAVRRVSEHAEPTTLGVQDYLSALARANDS